MIEQVYETMVGMLIKGACIPDVEDAFADGMPCQILYEDVLAAYSRIRARLNVEEEDEDVEIIINSFLQMQRILCCQMFIYGRTLFQNS